MTRPDQYACFGKKTEELGTLHEFDFCDGTLCSTNAVLFIFSTDSRIWTSAFDNLEKALEQRFGRPSVADVKVPDSCRADVFPCLHDGSANLLLGWQTPTRVVLLRMGSTGEGVPAISTFYATPEGARRLSEGKGGGNEPYRPAPPR
jgi:hypothetical protein